MLIGIDWLIMTLLVVCCTVAGDVALTRPKRFLVYPPGPSRIQLVLGVGRPIRLENHAVTAGMVLKLRYPLPTNATGYDPLIAFGKRSIESRNSRYKLYTQIESAMEEMGLGGKSCVLRSICEASDIPLRASGLLGELLYIFLTPSSTIELPSSPQDMDYLSAERLGRDSDINCKYLYPECKISLVDIITTIV